MTYPPPGDRGPGAGTGLVVLIVEDSEKNLKLARDVLRAAGFRTLEAANGNEGIELAGEHLPDVILMDLGLPDMNGTEAASRLADGQRTSHIPVVALSALPYEGADGWWLAAGFTGYLEKPISVREFPGQVHRWAMASKSGPAPR